MEYEAVIGLEIHAELKTRSKLFCDSPNDPDAPSANTNICPVCMGHPGTLPVLNEAAVRTMIRIGLALGGTIAPFAQFDRKNYFYPDLPKGYQISQYHFPIVTGGGLEFELASGERECVALQRIHLEEDTGRLIHDPVSGTSLVDFNRAGVPLMELVTEPVMYSAEEAWRFAEELQRVLQYLDASDANMEKGQMRIEANVSLRPAGREELGTKVELKNINSFRFVERAIAAEIKRQRQLLERGERVVQETRGWDESRGVTLPQRLKEESQDYRYFPEPDLPPLLISETLIQGLRIGLPELPAAKLRRFREEFALNPRIAATIIQDRRIADFFEEVVSELRTDDGLRDGAGTIRLAANYLTTDVRNLTAASGMHIHDSPVTAENFAELVTYLLGGKISSKTAKEVLREMFSSGVDPSLVIEERKLWQVSDVTAIGEVIDRVLKAQPAAAKDFQSGKVSALQFLVGHVLKESRGANPETVRKLLEERLKN